MIESAIQGGGVSVGERPHLTEHLRDGVLVEQPEYKASQAPLRGSVQQRPLDKTLDFQQAGELYRSFSETERANLIKNLAADLNQVRDPQVRAKMLSHFQQADPEYGACLLLGRSRGKA